MVCLSGIYIYILKNRAQKSQNILENHVYTLEIFNASKYDSKKNERISGNNFINHKNFLLDKNRNWYNLQTSLPTDTPDAHESGASTALVLSKSILR